MTTAPVIEAAPAEADTAEHSVKIAITFGVGYAPHKNVHPTFPNLDGCWHFIVVEGRTRAEARDKAFRITGGIHAFEYLYEVDGTLDADFQRQIQSYGYEEYAAGVFAR